MPKVNASYVEQKKDKILDAASTVAMRKPMYEVHMRDIISESGLSQGGIYRYFSNIDEIYIALINRNFTLLDVKGQIEIVFDYGYNPEKVVCELLLIWKRLVLDNIVGVGKIYFELCTVYANDKDRLINFITKSAITSESAYLQEKSIMYVVQQVEVGYFAPKLPLDNIIKFLITSLDGIVRDLILSRHYGSEEVLPFAEQLDENKLMQTLIVAFILLLGGNEKNIYLEVSSNESTK